MKFIEIIDALEAVVHIHEIVGFKQLIDYQFGTKDPIELYVAKII